MIAFNNERVIEQAIKGVVGQRFNEPFELVIVDDCSTDSTFAVAEKWQKKYPDIIKLYRNKNNIGLQANYLEAYSHCTGKYLALCDADDYWCSARKLATQVKYMEEHPECAVTFHRVVNLYESDGTMSLSNGGQKADTTIADIARSNYITNCSVMYRRELVDLTALPDWILSDFFPDYATHMFYAAKGSIHYFKRPMAVYRKSSQGAWSLVDSRRRLEVSLNIRKKLMEHFADRPEVVEGLRFASENIEKAIDNLGAGPQKKPRLLSSLRAFVSRFLPAPKPALPV